MTVEGMNDESKYREDLKTKMKEIKTNDDFFQFIETVKNGQHGYGTICVGIAQAMIATLEHINRSENGGITGFQASCVGWEVVKKTMMFGDGPVSMRIYENMLYPQYQDKFEKFLEHETWVWIQDEARKKYSELKEDSLCVESVRSHLKSIVDGQVPFGYTVKNPVTKR